MKIDELTNAPQWLRDAKTENADVILDEFGGVVWYGGEWRDGMWYGGEWYGGRWYDGVWRGGRWCGGEWRDGEWCDGRWYGGRWYDGVWRDGVWHDGRWYGGVWRDGRWCGGEWCDGEWRGGEWRGGEMKIDGKKVSQFRCFIGLYPYRVSAVLFEDGSRWVRMGCLWKSLEEWGRVDIRETNPDEFPNDGSDECEERVAAFEFARAAVLRMQ